MTRTTSGATQKENVAMQLSTRCRTYARRSSESGVSLIEMMIAILVLTIGLVTLAQLFIAATLNNSYVVTNTGGLDDAQRLIEHWKYVAATSTYVPTGATRPDGVSDPLITSSTYNTTTHQCDAFVNNVSGYNETTSQYKESVWVFKNDYSLVGSASPALPPGVSANTLKAPTQNSRLVYILMDPKSPDPRLSAPIILMGVIGGQ